MNDLKHWQFSLRLEILEPYSDLNIEHRGAEKHVEFRPLEDETLEAVEHVLERRAGQMKALAQVAIFDASSRYLRRLVCER